MAPATQNQLIRLAAPRYEVERRYSVLPPSEYVHRALFEAGQPVTLPPRTTTTAPVNRLTTTIPVLSTTGYPVSGIVPVQGRANGRGVVAWFTYSGTTSDSFTGCSFLRGYGILGTPIETGAVCALTVDITERVVESRTRGRTIKTGTKRDWRYQISGHFYNSMIMPNDCGLLIEMRLTPNGVFGQWTDWLVEAQGYVRDWGSEGDDVAQRRWDAEVVSWSVYAESKVHSARRYGEENIAAGISVTASTALANPYVEADEFRGGIGTTTADNVVDENPDTLYISDTVPTTTPEVEGSSGPAGSPLIEEIGIWFGEAVPAELQYIAIRLPRDAGGDLDGEGRGRLFREGVSLRNYVLTYSGTDYRASAVNDWPPEIGGCIFREGAWDCSGNYIRLPDVTLNEDNPVIIVTRNATIFRQYYAVESGVSVFDWRFLPGFANDGMTAANVLLNRPGDVVHLRYVQAGDEHTMWDMLAWGDPGEFDDAFFVNAADFAYHNTQWNDPNTVTIPADGNSIRRKPACTDTNTTADWDEEETPLPGTPRDSNNGVFIAFEFAPWEAHLAEDITDTVPGVDDWLELDTAKNLDFSGKIRLNLEHIAYSERRGNAVKVSERGADATTPASHTTAALVYQVDPVLGAHRLPKVRRVRWKRWERLFLYNGPGQTHLVPIAPRTVEIWGSTEEPPNFPTGGTWKPTWIGGTALYQWNIEDLRYVPRDVEIDFGGYRLSYAMLVIRRMSDLGIDGFSGRAKLNDVEFYTEQITLDDAPVSNGEVGAGAIFRDLLEETTAREMISLDAAAFVGTKADAELVEQPVGRTLDALCERYGLVRKWTRDNRVQIYRNPYHPLGNRPEVKAVITPDMMRAHLNKPRSTYRSKLGEIGQYVVEIRDDTTGEIYIGAYPPVRGPGRQEVIQLDVGAGDSEAATRYAATLYWSDPAITDSYSFATVGPGEWLDVDDRLVYFDFADDAAPTGRSVNVLVDGVEWLPDGYAQVEASRWQMV